MHSRILAILILASAVPALANAPGANPAAPASKPGKPIGHSPHPFLDVGRIDLFHGYRCGGTDCLLHQHGYQWGADHRIVNPRDCQGTSEEFLEGCRAFAGVVGPLGERDFDASFPHQMD